MSEIFRFLMLRPPEPAQPVKVGISPVFTEALKKALETNEGRDAVKVAASEVTVKQGVGSLAELTLAPKLLRLGRQIDRALDRDPHADVDVRALIKQIFDSTPLALVKSAEFKAERERLGDLLIAAKALSRDAQVPAVEIENVLRMMDVVQRVADKAPGIATADGLRLALSRPSLVGRVLDPLRPDPADRPGGDSAPDDGRDKRRQALLAKARSFGALSKALIRLRPEEFERPVEKEGTAEEEQTDLRDILEARLASKIREDDLESFGRGTLSAVVTDVDAVAGGGDGPALLLGAVPRLIADKQAVAGFEPEALKALKALEVELDVTPVPAALEQLGQELTAVHTELADIDAPVAQVALIGTSVNLISFSGPGALGKMSATVPTTHGSVQPVGVGDLLVVRQHIKRYEGGELGHIENVLDGEQRKRALKRARTTEETTTLEVETKKDEERDSQSTERFELQREASELIKQDQSLKAGLSVSGSYGPTVEFKAYADFAMNNAKERSAKTASKYSKEVTERAATKVSERRREERILRTLEVFEEINEHGIDNPAGNGHVIGAYQWVDKVYEGQVHNYGKRMMFDFMVPEPGSFWLHSAASRPKPGTALTRPLAFALTPAQLNEYNYATYVQRYQVAGVKPPPAPYLSIAKTFEGAAANADHGSFTKIADVPIPDGYQAVSAHIAAPLSFWQADWSLKIAVGKDFWSRAAGSFVDHYFTLDWETGSIPVAIKAWHVEKVAAALQIDCQRTDRALDQWRLETHATITQAWLKLESDYQDELAALEVQAANAVQGRNPAENRIIERTELRKLAITTLTAQHFDLFGAIGFSAQGYPQPDIAEADAEGRYIRFFEQAFEWEQMMYLFYPYYWGRKANWLDRSQLQDTDPQFAEFLRAGAARVVAPVRPGFESAVVHFLDTGEIWQGADPPLLTSPLYVSIIQEIKERDQAPGTEVAQGDPWDVRVPTTLVRLRPDGSLPEWKKNAAGEWVPV
jgi:hypothetical protein